MKCLHFFLVVVLSLFLLSCGGSSSSSSDSDDDSTSSDDPATTPDSDDSTASTPTAPTLTAADKESVTPCPNQAILTDASGLAELKDALKTGALSFLDVPIDGTDPDNFKKKCGLDGFWDPANNTDEITPVSKGMTATTVSQLLTNGNAGICSTAALPTNGITGFPAAGTYRGEIKAAKGGSTWHLRYRGVASGSATGNAFTDEDIDVFTDITDTLEYKVDGVVTAHADLLAGLVDAAAVSGESILLEASKTAGGAAVFSMATELICVVKI